MSKTVPFFTKKLIAWYLQNKRELPWRDTLDPYRIWLSEIILQQTRVVQGLPYYLKFVNAYPKVNDLALAPEGEVLKLWQGLGYYSRARNMHATAKKISEQMNGVFPNSYEELMNLKGVGDYTASAIASICFNKPRAVVDGNVFRVLSRVFGVDVPINSTQGKKKFKKIAQHFIDKTRPGTFNQAIMEFGARFCVPKNPDCNACIFNDRCVAFQQQKVAVLPVKIKSGLVKIRFFNYLVFLSGNEHTVLNQRNGKGIWHKLYEFPLIETSEAISASNLKKNPMFKAFTANIKVANISLFKKKPIVHKLSHQHLHTRFWIVEIIDKPSNAIPISEIENYAVPVLIADFVSEFFETD